MLKFFKHLLKSGYYYEVMAQVVKLYETGLIGRYDLSIGYDDEILCYFNEPGDLIGFIVFKVLEWDGGLFICMGWVAEDSRGKGVYTKQLYSALKVEAEKRECTYIRGVTSNHNSPAQQASERSGRKLDALMYTQYLEPDFGREI